MDKIVKEEEEITEEQKEEKVKFETLMKKQEEQRVLYNKKKLEQKAKYQDPQEQKDVISNKVKELKFNLNNLSEILRVMREKPSKSNLAMINEKFNGLNEYFINTSYAMHPYDKKQYKQQLDDLDNKIRDYKRKLKPRKKFKFKTKFKKTKIAQNEEVKQEEKEIENNLTIIQGLSGLTNETRVVSKENLHEIFKLEKLTNCDIKLEGNVQTAYIYNCENCRLSLGAIQTSVFIVNCNKSEIQVMAQQIRIHRSKATHFKTFCPGDIIIEDCKELKFSAFDYKYTGQKKDISETGFDKKVNNWRNIKDFKWLKQEKSPNFEIIE